MKKVTSIEFPNTSDENTRERYSINSISISKVDDIKRVTKAGEMANIGWFEVWKNGKLLAEIKESVCNIYYA